MRILRASIAVVLLAVFAVGCSEQNVPTASSEVVPTPSFGIGNAPVTSGPNIIRGQIGFAMFYVDLDTGRLAVIGTDIVAFCTSGAPFDVVNFQNISVPEDANRLSVLIQGTDMTTSVWPFTAFDCGLFTTLTPLGTGTADLINTDNDLLTFLNPDSRNANAFGFRWHGKLADPSGNKVQASGHCLINWDGVDGSKFFNIKDKIQVRTTLPVISNFPATFAPASAAVGDTVLITATGFLFTPTATVDFNGNPANVVARATDSTSVSVVLLPDTSPFTGPVTVNGIIPLAAPQFVLSIPSDIDVTQAAENFAGTSSVATAPVLTLPSSGNTTVFVDGGPFATGLFGFPTRWYRFALAASTTFDFSGTWTNNDDLGYYFVDQALTSIFGAADNFGGGPSGHPETATITLPAGTYLLAVLSFGSDDLPGAFTMEFSVQ